MARHFDIFIMANVYDGNVADPPQPVDSGSSSSVSSGSSISNPVFPLFTSIIDYFFGEARAARQHTRNHDDWEVTNEYNLPTNQYDRLVQAGASPSAAIASLTGQNNNAALVNPTSQSLPQSTFTDALLGNAHLDIDRNLAMAEIDKRQAEARMYDTISNRNETLTPKEAQKLDEEIDHLVGLKQLDDASRRQIEYFTDRAKRFEEKDFEKLNAEIHRIKSDAANLDWDAYFKMRYGSLEHLSEIAKNNAIAYNNQMSGNLARNQAINEITKGDILKAQKIEAEFDAWYLEVFGAKPDADVKKQFFTAYNVDRYGKEDYKDAAPLRMINAVEYYLDSGLNMLNDVGSRHKILRNYVITKEGSHFLQDWIDSASNYFKAVGSLKR